MMKNCILWESKLNSHGLKDSLKPTIHLYSLMRGAKLASQVEHILNHDLGLNELWLTSRTNNSVSQTGIVCNFLLAKAFEFRVKFVSNSIHFALNVSHVFLTNTDVVLYLHLHLSSLALIGCGNDSLAWLGALRLNLRNRWLICNRSNNSGGTSDTFKILLLLGLLIGKFCWEAAYCADGRDWFPLSSAVEKVNFSRLCLISHFLIAR